MKLTEILAISGAPGLHKYVAQGRGGIIVESLGDKKRSMVSGSAKVSALGDIAVFTSNEEVPLADIFTAIFKNYDGKSVDISNKSNENEVKAFFEKVLPDYDRERVHLSDVKKIANWYNTLVGAGVTEFSVNDEEIKPEEVEKEVASTDKTVKKTVAKKTTAAAGVKKATAAKPAAPKAGGSKVKATKSTTARKSQ